MGTFPKSTPGLANPHLQVDFHGRLSSQPCPGGGSRIVKKTRVRMGEKTRKSTKKGVLQPTPQTTGTGRPHGRGRAWTRILLGRVSVLGTGMNGYLQTNRDFELAPEQIRNPLSQIRNTRPVAPRLPNPHLMLGSRGRPKGHFGVSLGPPENKKRTKREQTRTKERREKEGMRRGGNEEQRARRTGEAPGKRGAALPVARPLWKCGSDFHFDPARSCRRPHAPGATGGRGGPTPKSRRVASARDPIRRPGRRVG